MLAALLCIVPFLPLSCPCPLPSRSQLGALLVPLAGLYTFLACTLPFPTFRLLLLISPPFRSLRLRARASRRNRRAA